MVPLTATVPEVFVTTMTIFLSYSFDALEDTLTHMKSPKPKKYPGENVTDFCAAMLVDAEFLDNSGAFRSENLG